MSSGKHSAISVTALLAIGACAVLLPARAGAAAQKPATKSTASQPLMLFSTPKEAGETLVRAAEQFDVKTFSDLFGPENLDVVVTEDPVDDKNQAAAFVAKAKEKSSYVTGKTSVTMCVGPDDWPLPIPIVKQGNKWRFDAKAGRQEILNRRIGRNEYRAIEICRGYVEAQKEYAESDHDGNGVLEYAQKIISTPGRHDGLSWQNPDGTSGGPIGDAVAKALAEGYPINGEPFHGYHFKILKRQGPAAPLGELNYVIQGKMVGGFALAAWPAEYRVTGVKTFIVSHDGIVYQKDLGEYTEMAGGLERYNPDASWTPVEDEAP